MSIEIGSLYNFRKNPNYLFVVLSFEETTKILVGGKYPTYDIKGFDTSGKHINYIVCLDQLVKVA